MDWPSVYKHSFDVLIIGTGAGGGAVLHALQQSEIGRSQRIAVLERGTRLPNELQNQDPMEVMANKRYRMDEKWLTRRGRKFQPALHFNVGGNTKYYAAALYRFRESDFHERAYADGLSPAWPISYETLRPYYDQAEALFQVRGNSGEDPTDPPGTGNYVAPALEHEEALERTAGHMASEGWKPLHIPLGVSSAGAANWKPENFDPAAPCMRCDRCGGHPCRVSAKSDSERLCIDPALKNENVQLFTDHQALSLQTDLSGRRVTGAIVETPFGQQLFEAKWVILAAGASGSALLLQASQTDQHPDGIGNQHGLVGANYMYHIHSLVMVVDDDLPPVTFPKTLAFHHHYEAPDAGTVEADTPAGIVQIVGALDRETLAAQAAAYIDPRIIPKSALEVVGNNNLSFLVSTEDLPLKTNRVSRSLHRGKMTTKLNYRPTNLDAHLGLVEAFKDRIKAAVSRVKPFDSDWFTANQTFAYSREIPSDGNAHQVGTLAMDAAEQEGVVDADCRVFGMENLYVADGSVFRSSAAVNPALTIIANALRVGDKIKERL